MKNLNTLILTISSLFIFGCSSNKKIASFEEDFKQDYKLEKIVYDIKDNKSRRLLEKEVEQTKFKKGQSLAKLIFINERKRITSLIRKNINPDFSEDKVRFEIDTTLANNKFSVLAIVGN